MREYHDTRYKIYRNGVILFDPNTNTTAMLLHTRGPAGGQDESEDYELTTRGTRFKSDDRMVIMMVMRGDDGLAGMMQLIETQIQTIASEDLPGLELVQESCCPVCAQGQQYLRLKDQRLSSANDVLSPDRPSTSKVAAQVAALEMFAGDDRRPLLLSLANLPDIPSDFKTRSGGGSFGSRFGERGQNTRGALRMSASSESNNGVGGAKGGTVDGGNPSSDKRGYRRVKYKCPLDHAITTTEINDGYVVQQRDTARNQLWDPLLRDHFLQLGTWTRVSSNLSVTTLTHSETLMARAIEFKRAKAWFDQYVAADPKCNYVLDRIVFLRNTQLEQEFAGEFRELAAKAMSIEMDWVTGIAADSSSRLQWNADDTEEQRRRRIRVLRHLDESVLRFSGNEGINAIMVCVYGE